MNDKNPIFLIALLVLLSANVQAGESTYAFECDSLTSTAAGDCLDKVRKKTSGPFNFGMWNNNSYDIATTWVRAKAAGQSNYFDIHTISGNIPHADGHSSGANGVIFEFDADYLQGKIGVDLATLKKGFYLYFKIKSVGAGSGLEDKCHPAEVKFDDKLDAWIWRKDDKSASWHQLASDKIYLWEVNGSVNDVKCGLKDVGGSVVSG